MNKISEYIDYLYNLERSDMKYNLKNIKLILKFIDNPHLKLKCIHIAGTNGKGGTASFIASILMEHKLKVGLFTSPHILKFNERIRVNGKCITDSYIKEFISKNFKYFNKIKPSFFEVNTAIALRYFLDKKVDAAVIETGLGGRLDSTNIIKRVLSVITQIGIDHTEYLGNTLEKITKEKMGIVKPNVDVVVSDNHKGLKKMFSNNIKESNLFYIDDCIEVINKHVSLNGSEFKLEINNKKIFPELNSKRLSFRIPLQGEYQIRNAATAVFSTLLFIKKQKIFKSISNFKRGLERVKINTGYRARFEIVNKKESKYILDVSHNPDSIRAALKNVELTGKCIIVCSMMKDKDYRKSIKEMLKFSDIIIFTKPDYKRALDPFIMYDYAKRLNKKKKIFYTENVRESIFEAKRISSGKRNVRILFIGSFFLISEVIRILNLESHFK